MGLDSVEMVMAWEQAFGSELSSDEMATLTTPGRVVDLICTKLGAAEFGNGSCLTLRAFLRLRRSLVAEAGMARNQVRPSARINDLVPRSHRRTIWKSVRSATAWPGLPGPGWFSNRTMGEMAQWVVAFQSNDLRERGSRRTRPEVRTVVRAVVSECLGIPQSRIGDDDDFLTDLGMS